MRTSSGNAPSALSPLSRKTYGPPEELLPPYGSAGHVAFGSPTSLARLCRSDSTACIPACSRRRAIAPRRAPRLAVCRASEHPVVVGETACASTPFPVLPKSPSTRRRSVVRTACALTCLVTGCGGSLSVSSSAYSGDGGSTLDATSMLGASDGSSSVTRSQGRNRVHWQRLATSSDFAHRRSSILTCQNTLASFSACWSCAKRTMPLPAHCVRRRGTPRVQRRARWGCELRRPGGAVEGVLPRPPSCPRAIRRSRRCNLASSEPTGRAGAPPSARARDRQRQPTPVPRSPFAPNARRYRRTGNAMCVQTSSCQMPSCPVGGAACCTPSGLCGCATAIAGGPDLTCN